MKKIIYVFTSIIVLTAMIGINNFAAFAQTTTKYWEPRPNVQGAEGYVNSKSADGIYIVADTETGGSKITYNGDGKLTGWEFPLLEEGKDYEIISQEGNSITIKLINENHELPYINALVDFGETTTAKSIEQTIKQNIADEASTVIEETNENKVNTTEETTLTTKIETTSEAIANDKEESNIKNTNIIIVPCVIVCAICIVLTAIVLTKNRKKQ